MAAVDETIERLVALATRAIEEDRPLDAIEPAQRAVDLSDKAYGRVTAESATYLELLGKAQHYSNHHDSASSTVSEALRIRQQLFGMDSPQALGTMLVLGRILFYGTTPRAATPVFKQALTIMEQNLDKSPQAYETTVTYIAEEYRDALSTSEVPAVLFRRAIRNYSRAGLAHSDSALRLCTLLMAATPPAGQADSHSSVHPAPSPSPENATRTPHELLLEGKALAHKGRAEEAQDILSQALSRAWNYSGPDKAEVQTAIAEEMGDSLMQADDAISAEPWLLVAYHRRKHFAGSDDIRTALAISRLGLAYDKQGKLTAGEEAHTRAIETFSQFGKDAGPILIYLYAALERLSENLYLQKRYDEAESTVKQSVAVQNELKFHSGVCRLMTWDLLKRIYVAQERLEDAKNLLAVMAEEQEDQFGNTDGALARMLEELCSYCDKLGDSSLGSATRARLAALSA